MLILYGTQGCHLCDQAEALMEQAGASRAVEWQYVDIALNEKLVEKYSTRIPVLVTGEGQEIGWPFSLLDILNLKR